VTKFLIRYQEPNLSTEVWREATVEFEDWRGKAVDHSGNEIGPEFFISAKTWAEDFAYAVADKGIYEIKELSA
jgi:hypothetical protein